MLSPSLHDIASYIINDIHCESEDNLKIIIEGDILWVTSTLIYPFEVVGNLSYNISERHLVESLRKTRQILQ